MKKGSISIDVLVSILISFIILNLLLNTIYLQVKSEELIEYSISEYETDINEIYRGQKECEPLCTMNTEKE